MATLVIDLGGTFARAAVVDAQGNIIASAKMALGERSPSAVVESIAHAAKAAVDTAGTPVQGCGVGAAGQIHGDSGVLAGGPQPRLGERPPGGVIPPRG